MPIPNIYKITMIRCKRQCVWIYIITLIWYQTQCVWFCKITLIWFQTQCAWISKEGSTCPDQVKDVLYEHTNNIQKMLDNFQSNTVHSLEISLVSAIEKLSSVQSARSNNDQQSQISKLLQDKDNLMREKDNLLKQRRNGFQDENQHSATKPEL